MKPIKIFILLIAVVFASCKKDNVGPAGPAGASGDTPKTYYYTGAISNELTYNGLMNDFLKDDAVIVSIRVSVDLAGVETYATLPYKDAATGNYYYSIIATDGKVKIYRDQGDITFTPTKKFKLVLVKGQML